MSLFPTKTGSSVVTHSYPRLVAQNGELGQLFHLLSLGVDACPRFQKFSTKCVKIGRNTCKIAGKGAPLPVFAIQTCYWCPIFSGGSQGWWGSRMVLARPVVVSVPSKLAKNIHPYFEWDFRVRPAMFGQSHTRPWAQPVSCT